MGSDDAEVGRLVKETGKDWFQREAPRHQVELAPFALARYPTTNAMFRRFWEVGYADAQWWADAKTAGVWKPKGIIKDWQGERNQPAYWDDTRFNGENQPLVGVTWYEAAAYCRWLTKQCNDGHVYRLPTEAEWERAARGPEGRRYPWGDDWAEGRANSEELKLDASDGGRYFPGWGQCGGGVGSGRQRLGMVQRLV